MPWKPLPRDRLDAMISDALAEADDTVRAAWERIRIEPTRWRCSPWGDEGGGFWVVGDLGGRVIWFNDIEDGFNVSAYAKPGVIDEYICNQATLGDILADLPEARVAERFAAERPTVSVPGALRTPGRIARRQTTFWTFQPDAGPSVRAHFSDKQETRFAAESYDQVEITDSHPLLRDYEEPCLKVYVSGLQRRDANLAEILAARVDQAAHCWRNASVYLGGPRHLHSIIDAGDGCLAHAPETMAHIIVDVVSERGAKASLLPHRPARLGYRVLLAGWSFVVARAFRFD